MNHLKERINLALSRGGMNATLFWILKILCRVEVHFLYAIDLSGRSIETIAHTSAPHFHFISLHTSHDINSQDPELINQLNNQSGWSVNQLVEHSSTVYALVDGTSPVSQLNICWKHQVTVDSPTHLVISLKPKDAFLGYLFTHPQYRGYGAATRLIMRISEDAAQRKYSRIITHIRSTNAPSLNTFKKSGWKRIGWILTSINGRLLKVFLPYETGISISKVTNLTEPKN